MWLICYPVRPGQGELGGVLNTFMPTASRSGPDLPDHFRDISLTKAIFRKYLKVDINQRLMDYDHLPLKWFSIKLSSNVLLKVL